MKIKKSVTDKVIAANCANARKSTGPHDVAAVETNGVKHGLLARQMKFENEDERLEFGLLLESVHQEYQPSGPTGAILVEEIATCIWKLKIAYRWEAQELENRSNAAALVCAVAENYYEQPLPMFRKADGSRSTAQLGWVCEELIIQSGSRKGEQEYGSGLRDRDYKDKAGQVSIEAKLGSGLDMVLRYQVRLKKDLYRAIAELRKASSAEEEK
jgi:hypothetical protein